MPHLNHHSDNQLHYRLHKVHKRWVTMTIVSIAMGSVVLVTNHQPKVSAATFTTQSSSASTRSSSQATISVANQQSSFASASSVVSSAESTVYTPQQTNLSQYYDQVDKQHHLTASPVSVTKPLSVKFKAHRLTINPSTAGYPILKYTKQAAVLSVRKLKPVRSIKVSLSQLQPVTYTHREVLGFYHRQHQFTVKTTHRLTTYRDSKLMVKRSMIQANQLLQVKQLHFAQHQLQFQLMDGSYVAANRFNLQLIKAVPMRPVSTTNSSNHNSKSVDSFASLTAIQDDSSTPTSFSSVNAPTLDSSTVTSLSSSDNHVDTSTDNAEADQIAASVSASIAANLAASQSASTAKSIADSKSASDAASTSASIAASQSASTVKSIADSKAASASASTSASIAASQSASVVKSIADSKSASDAASTSASIAASQSASVAKSIADSKAASDAASTAASISASQSASTAKSIADSKAASISASQSASTAKSIADSKAASISASQSASVAKSIADSKAASDAVVSAATNAAKSMAIEAQSDMDAESADNRMANFDAKWAYDGDDLGATYTNQQSTLKVWAPTDQAVSVVTYNQNHQQTGVYAMTRGTQVDMNNHVNNTIGVFTTHLTGDQNGTIYTYRITHADGSTTETQDPYSVAVTDNGNKSVIVNLSDTNPQNWTTTNPKRVANPTQAIVGETQVRDFSNSSTSGVQDSLKGTLLGMAQTDTKDPNTGLSTTFDYLKQGGINYLELQPIADDETDEATPKAYTWGYDTKNFNVVNPSYASDSTDPTSGIRDLKTMVQAYHQAGINVIMDVVYNHIGGDATQSPFNKLVPGYYFRKDASGNLTNGSVCGNDFASDHEMGRNFIVNSTNYWVHEYGIDGFRFDLMTSLSTPTMQAIQNNLASQHTLLFGEGWDMNTTNLAANQMANLGNANQLAATGFFNGSFRDAVAGRNHGSYNGWVSGNWNQSTIDTIVNSITGGHNLTGASFVNPGQNVNYVENHDDQTLSDKLWAENPSDDAMTHGLRMSLANAMNGLNQGITFTQIGQSFWRNKEGNDNSFNAGDTINNVNWDYLKYHQDTDAQMTQILKLKAQYPAAFSMDNYQAIQQNITIDNATSNGVISYTIHSPQGKFIVFYNATNQPVQIGNGSTANLSNNYHDVNFNYGVNRASNNEITNQNGQLSVPGLSYVVYRFDS